MEKAMYFPEATCNSFQKQCFFSRTQNGDDRFIKIISCIGPDI